LYCKVTLFLCLIATASCDNTSDKKKDDSDSSWTGSIWKPVAVGLAAVGGATVAVVAAPVVLGFAGFTTAGVAAGSAAAAAQSYLGVVAAGSAFAALQSAGAAGVGAATMAAGAAAGGTAAFAATCC